MNKGHGGDIYSRKIKLDFSANINPLGMPQSVKKALADHICDCEHYPDVNCTELANAIAMRENVSADNIVCGNGAADIIYRIVRTLMPKKALLPVPSFSEYEKALRDENCEIVYHYLDEKNGFSLDEDFLDKLRGIDIVFLADPNNPTGRVTDRRLMDRIIEKCSENGICLVLDRCFIDFVKDSENYSAKPPESNVMILKAFTKIYAMPGLRLGYLICPDESLAEKIRGCGQCWSVSVPAQTAGLAALGEEGYIGKTVELISAERKYLTDALKKFGFKVYSSDANFILFRCGIMLEKPLLAEGIAVRCCDNFIGLGSGFFRIAVRTHDENTALINAIERILKNGKTHNDTGHNV